MGAGKVPGGALGNGIGALLEESAENTLVLHCVRTQQENASVNQTETLTRQGSCQGLDLDMQPPAL